MSDELEHPGERRKDLPSELGKELARERGHARIFVTDVAPHWNERVAKLLFARPLPKSRPARALDVHCAHGDTTLQLLEGLHPKSQVLALQADPGLEPIAQAKLSPHKHRVHLHPGNFDDITTLPDGQFDFVNANLVLGQAVPDWQLGLTELFRLLAPGGQLRATLALKGTWHDATQLTLEVLESHGAQWAHDQLMELELGWPIPRAVLQCMLDLTQDRQDLDLQIDRFEILFANARDFFRAPLVQQGPLAIWRALLRRHQNPKAMLWKLREAFDAHYESHVLALPVVAAVTTLRKPKRKGSRKALSYATLADFPQLQKLNKPKTRSKSSKANRKPPA